MHLENLLSLSFFSPPLLLFVRPFSFSLAHSRAVIFERTHKDNYRARVHHLALHVLSRSPFCSHAILTFFFVRRLLSHSLLLARSVRRKIKERPSLTIVSATSVSLSLSLSANDCVCVCMCSACLVRVVHWRSLLFSFFFRTRASACLVHFFFRAR